jgi:cell wall-associated NlpC family hydrolase
VGDPGETSYSSLELETLGLINDYREENGLGPLLLSDLVSTAAARYAHDMAKYDAYNVPEAHVTGPSDYYPEGADLAARMNAGGYSASGYGENIAAGQETARGVFEAWRTSPPHNEMMLNPEMRVIGIGLVENPETSYEEFWVTDFGSDEDETSRPVSEAGSDPSGQDGGATVGEETPVAPGPPTASLPKHCDPFIGAGLVRLAAPGGKELTTAPEPGAGSATGKEVVEEAEKYLGTPYVLGGPEVCDPGTQMDCTCLTTTVFRRFGYELPDMPTALMEYGEPVEGPPQAGDVHVWGDPGDGTGGHVAIEVGDGQIVHANMGTMDASVTPMWDSPNYLGARRLVE